MERVVLVIHLMVAVALIGVVLMQKSEGGAEQHHGAGEFLEQWAQGNARDPLILLAGVVLLSGVAAIASAMPARHAADLVRPPTAVLVPGLQTYPRRVAKSIWE